MRRIFEELCKRLSLLSVQKSQCSIHARHESHQNLLGVRYEDDYYSVKLSEQARLRMLALKYPGVSLTSFFSFRHTHPWVTQILSLSETKGQVQCSLQRSLGSPSAPGNHRMGRGPWLGRCGVFRIVILLVLSKEHVNRTLLLRRAFLSLGNLNSPLTKLKSDGSIEFQDYIIS